MLVWVYRAVPSEVAGLGDQWRRVDQLGGHQRHCRPGCLGVAPPPPPQFPAPCTPRKVVTHRTITLRGTRPVCAIEDNGLMSLARVCANLQCDKTGRRVMRVTAMMLPAARPGLSAGTHVGRQSPAFDLWRTSSPNLQWWKA